MTTNSPSDIQEIIQQIIKFRDERDWEQFHDARNLAMCLNVEASELLEVFLWKKPEEAKIEKIEEELADVFYAAFLLAEKYGFDVKEIVTKKLMKNAEKYPIEKALGSNKKYDEL
ncbi:MULTISPECIES: nucleotide pyrophosphohydrolase [Bacteroidota]|uniref:nucleotide pyrophosphohydrolase n=1 Tax=Bacteroidota TaxID=976 RepID=UPI0014134CF3|nr:MULTISPECIES: nucleotide pyrophosphohydrolase [Bacteroidota]MDI9882034.1 nucleotide pyrophosphohydrolase [Flectobacillus longus]NBB31188.1 nucleotide pyrophosphohydrolase [Cellulophaga sp. BC115SP]